MSDRWVRVVQGLVLAVALASALGHVASELRRAPGNEWNDVRLAPSAGLLEGLPLYTPRDSGVLLGHVYGPLPVLFYGVPVWLASTPMLAIQLAILVGIAALLVVLLPWVRDAGGTGYDLIWSVAVVLLLGRASAILWPVVYAVHPDVWSVTWALAGCALLSRSNHAGEDRTYLAGAGFCFAIAIGCKQTMVLAPLGAAAVLGLVLGPRAVWVFLGSVAVGGLSLIAMVSLLTDPGDMLWTAIHLPSLHPWRGPGGWSAIIQSARDLIPRVAPIALTLIAVAIVRKDIGSRLSIDLTAPWVLPLAVAVANIPMGLVGRAKMGGSMNTLAYSYAFVAFALISAMVAITPQRRRVRWAQTAVLAVLLVGAGDPWNPQDPKAWLPGAERVSSGFGFALDHPGQVYFPFHPLIGYYADGKVYHVSDGIGFRQMSGVAVPREHILAHVPDDLQWIATARLWPDAVLDYFTDCKLGEPPPGLVGWEVRACSPSGR